LVTSVRKGVSCLHERRPETAPFQSVARIQRVVSGADPTAGGRVEFLRADWSAWDAAVNSIPQPASSARDELRTKLQTDRALLGEANESRGGALLSRFLRPFRTGSATDCGECPHRRR
jgi:hypothetical protein